MNFKDLVKDIQKLIGLELESIRPGAKITIIDVNEERRSLTLRTSSGQNRSRPLDELQKIWNEMMIEPAVHVEGVLHGSGTSRNQPETILANLPYIEWLKIDNKKHIAYVGKNTHAFGTLRQMDLVLANEVISKMRTSKGGVKFSTAIVAKDVNQSIQKMQSICQGVVTTIERGIYQLQTHMDIIIFLAADVWELEEGTYCVIESGTPMSTEKKLTIYGKYYSVICSGNIKALVKRS